VSVVDSLVKEEVEKTGVVALWLVAICDYADLIDVVKAGFGTTVMKTRIVTC